MHWRDQFAHLTHDCEYRAAECRHLWVETPQGLAPGLLRAAGKRLRVEQFGPRAPARGVTAAIAVDGGTRGGQGGRATLPG